MRKAQVSFEFIMIFSLALVMVAGFTYIINQRLSDISKEQELMVMKNFANSIKNEVLLAASVSNNYLRRFEIPGKLNGKVYNLSMKDDSLTVKIYEGGKLQNEYFTVFPTHVKGSFIEDINYNNTEHCITKNEYDGIRIARNQVSLDANSTFTKKGDIIEILVSMNCVKNIRSAQFTLKYDPLMLSLLDKTKPVTYQRRELNPLFESVTVLPYSTNPEGIPYTSSQLGRYTFGFIGSNCATGSGNIAQLFFNVSADSGSTEIEFDPSFGDSNLIVLDCTTNKLTQEDLPDSKKGADIEITG